MMMATIVLIVIYNIIFIYQIFKKKNIFGLGTIINFSINLNFILYLCKWSRYIEEEPYIGTYILINSIIIVFIIVMLLSKSPVSKLLKNEKRIELKKINIYKNKVSIYIIINIAYISLFLIENIIGSGHIAPNLVGIDIHTYSAPLISFITRGLYVMVFLNYIAFDTFKEKKYIFFIVFDILLFPILRGGRINIFMVLIQFTLFFVMYNLKTVLKNKKIIVGLIAIACIFVVLGVFMGNKRVDKNLEGNALKGKIRYEDHIKYSGPKDPIGIMPWYYGYFPMSFANLNETIKYIDSNNLRTNGIYSLRPVLVGCFQMDNLIPNYKDIEYASGLAQYYTTAATVRTGFMEFYLDFGKLAGIPILIYALVGVGLYNLIKKNIYFVAMYAFFAGCWFFMSFQNMMIDVTTLYGLMYLYLIYKFCVKKTIQEKEII